MAPEIYTFHHKVPNMMHLNVYVRMRQATAFQYRLLKPSTISSQEYLQFRISPNISSSTTSITKPSNFFPLFISL
jgi:hypothetical protein